MTANNLLSFKRAFLDTPDGQIHYRIGGTGEPLLLLHQTPRSALSSYGEVIPTFAEERLVIAMDNPGYGDSDRPARPFSMADFARTAIMLLDSLGISKTSILGHHTGSAIAIEIASQYSERVDKLILSFPLPLLDEEERQLGYKVLKDTYQKWNAREDGSHLMELWQTVHQRTAKELSLVTRLVLDYMKAMEKGDLCFAYDAVFTCPMEERLPRITAPTLIIWGIEDLEQHDKIWGFHSMQNRHRVAEAIPRSKVIEISGPESTAAIINIIPDKFAGMVLDFLRDPGI
jgi:pimeloyl-ACP methyl ester carboxylesterase